MPKIKHPPYRLHGIYYCLDVIEISESQFNEITKGAGQESSFFDELVDDLYKSHQLGGYYLGKIDGVDDDGEERPPFWIESEGKYYLDPSNLTKDNFPNIDIFEKEISIKVSQSKELLDAAASSKNKISTKTYHLIYEDWIQYNLSIKKLKNKFDPNKLKIVNLSLKLMDGTIKKTVNVMYAGLDYKHERGESQLRIDSY